MQRVWARLFLISGLVCGVCPACNSGQPRKINSAAEIALKGALGNRDDKKIREAIKDGARVNIRNRDGSTLLEYAVAGGDKNLVELIVDHGADLTATTRGFTPLMSAAWNGRVDLLRILAKNGADLNARDDYGRTALMLAVSHNKLPAVKFLIEKGADKNLRESDGYTALDIGIKEKRYQIVQYLRTAGAKRQENAGTTAYRPVSPEFTCDERKQYPLVVAFISYGAGPNISAPEILRSHIRRWPKPVKFGSGGYGPEGEHSYCFPFEGYSEEEQNSFYSTLKKELDPFPSASVRQDSAIRTYPDYVPGPGQTHVPELKHKNPDRPRQYLPLRKGAGDTPKKRKQKQTK